MSEPRASNSKFQVPSEFSKERAGSLQVEGNLHSSHTGSTANLLRFFKLLNFSVPWFPLLHGDILMINVSKYLNSGRKA